MSEMTPGELAAFEAENDRRIALAKAVRSDLDRRRLEQAGADSVNGRPLTGSSLIAQERARQIQREGWTDEHDDEHTDGELAIAAGCYALPGDYKVCKIAPDGIPIRIDAWPWAIEFDKRDKHGAKRRLVVAGALIAAEIDRLIRAEMKASNLELPPTLEQDAVEDLKLRLRQRFPDDPEVQAFIDAYNYLDGLFCGLRDLSVDEQGMEIVFEGIGARNLISMLGMLFVKSGATNYCEWKLSSPLTGPIVINIQRKYGKTPSDIAGLELRRNEKARESLEAIVRDLSVVNDNFLAIIVDRIKATMADLALPKPKAEYDVLEAEIHIEIRRRAAFLQDVKEFIKASLASRLMGVFGDLIKRCNDEEASIESSKLAHPEE